MKKLFTMIAVCAAMFIGSTASAGTNAHLSSHSSFSQNFLNNYSSLRSGSACDTLSNLSVADSLEYYFPMDTSAAGIQAGAIPGLGYFGGNGALEGGSGFYTILAAAEKFDAPAGLAGASVSSALVGFGYWNINPTTADSAIVVTAYVYDTTGTSPIGGYAPGHAIDSATTTLGFIVTYGGAEFVFPNHATLASNGFFIAIKLPQVVGDTIAVALNNGSSGYGQAWFEIGAGAGTEWAPDDSVVGANVGHFIFPVVCGSACPTITVIATELGSTTSASATATGGVAPYTYSWSSSAATDTATGLTNGSTYTVTAKDANGCTGTATVSISTGIEAIAAGVTNFSVFPNPSNGVFTANVSLVAASDVTISVTDMTGSKIFESTDKAVKDLNKQINLSSVATGIYFVSVKTAQGTANQRIVIK